MTRIDDEKRRLVVLELEIEIDLALETSRNDALRIEFCFDRSLFGMDLELIAQLRIELNFTRHFEFVNFTRIDVDIERRFAIGQRRRSIVLRPLQCSFCFEARAPRQ